MNRTVPSSPLRRHHRANRSCRCQTRRTAIGGQADTQLLPPSVRACVMTWASWTTTGIYAGAGGVLTEEVGVISGDLTVHTTWSDSQAQIAVQFSGASDWYTMAGSPVPCPSEE